MCAAVWSVPAAQVLEFPVQMLVRFWVNHHLLDIVQRPMWRVVKGRSAQYVRKALQDISRVRTGTHVTRVVAAESAAGVHPACCLHVLHSGSLLLRTAGMQSLPGPVLQSPACKCLCSYCSERVARPL